jgi:putative transposase
MARLPRLDIPGVPQHLIQRGNNRSACFFEEQDRFAYLDYLRETSQRNACAIHAYVLMTNHIHLLVTGGKKGAVSAMMQALGLRYVRYINRVYRRTGTLFEGRFKSSLVQSERYLLTCYRYIELNPVRAALVADPGDYRWSSYRHHALGDPNGLITDHSEYLSLGDTPGERRSAYTELIKEVLPDEDIAAIRLHLNKDCALGTRGFQDRIEAVAKRRARVAAPGRPKTETN